MLLTELKPLGQPLTGRKKDLFMMYNRNEMPILSFNKLKTLDTDNKLYEFNWYTKSYNCFLTYHLKDSFNDCITKYRIEWDKSDNLADLMEILNNDNSKDEIWTIPLSELLKDPRFMKIDDTGFYRKR